MRSVTVVTGFGTGCGTLMCQGSMVKFLGCVCARETAALAQAQMITKTQTRALLHNPLHPPAERTTVAQAKARVASGLTTEYRLGRQGPEIGGDCPHVVVRERRDPRLHQRGVHPRAGP